MSKPPRRLTEPLDRLDTPQFVERYRGPLMRYFSRRGVDAPRREDLMQETFARLFGLADRAHVLNPEAYLFQIAASVMTDHFRHAQSHRDAAHVPMESVTPVAEVLTPDRVLEGKEALARVREALGELKPKTREMFLLNRWDGLSYTQIAVRFGVSPSAVEKHMIKAIAHLHKRLKGF
jgi:RNA polymerase sigma factor (sigma-70 family)